MGPIKPGIRPSRNEQPTETLYHPCVPRLTPGLPLPPGYTSGRQYRRQVSGTCPPSRPPGSKTTCGTSCPRAPSPSFIDRRLSQPARRRLEAPTAGESRSEECRARCAILARSILRTWGGLQRLSVCDYCLDEVNGKGRSTDVLGLRMGDVTKLKVMLLKAPHCH